MAKRLCDGAPSCTYSPPFGQRLLISACPEAFMRPAPKPREVAPEGDEELDDDARDGKTPDAYAEEDAAKYKNAGTRARPPPAHPAPPPTAPWDRTLQ